jgi:probable rRNA maturation factor
MRQFQVDLEISVQLPHGAEEVVRKAIIRTLTLESDLEQGILTVLLAGEEDIRTLNKRFLGFDKPTDVLSFPTGEITPGTEGYLGDIALCVPVARRQADLAGYPLEVELQLLAVHATLHLLGHDHANTQDRQAMWNAQDKVLSDLGILFAAPT